MNSLSPSAAIDSLTAPDWSHFWKSAGSITTTLPTMPECSVPQYSAQNKWYVPGLVAWNHMLV